MINHTYETVDISYCDITDISRRIRRRYWLRCHMLVMTLSFGLFWNLETVPHAPPGVGLTDLDGPAYDLVRLSMQVLPSLIYH